MGRRFRRANLTNLAVFPSRKWASRQLMWWGVPMPPPRSCPGPLPGSIMGAEGRSSHRLSPLPLVGLSVLHSILATPTSAPIGHLCRTVYLPQDSSPTPLSTSSPGGISGFTMLFTIFSRQKLKGTSHFLSDHGFPFLYCFRTTKQMPFWGVVERKSSRKV